MTDATPDPNLYDSLDGQVALVTGANRGIGREIAANLNDRGATVFAATRSVTHEVPDAWEHLLVDVTQEGEVSGAADEIFGTAGRLDIVVNNAGIEQHIDFLEVTEEDFDRLMDINHKGVFFGAQAAAPRLAENGGGTIINMASLAAVRGAEFEPLYAPSKAAVQHLTYSLADRLGDDDIRVNCINPGWTETQMLADSPMGEGEEGKQFEAMVKEMIPAGRFGQPQEVANVALFLASDLSSYVNGERIIVDGGFAHT